MQEHYKNCALSIIIPVYNVEDYLENCLESCIAQNLSDYEIICVDDGSTDKSSAILDIYAEKYDFITVFHKENGGVSSARNFGIERAHGKWIWFVDADDYISTNCCSYILNVAEQNNVELVMFDNIKTLDYQKETFAETEVEVSYFSSQDDVLSMSTKRNYGNGPFMYWFLRDRLALHSLKFDETMKYAEDTKFVFTYKFCCKIGRCVKLTDHQASQIIVDNLNDRCSKNFPSKGI